MQISDTDVILSVEQFLCGYPVLPKHRWDAEQQLAGEALSRAGHPAGSEYTFCFWLAINKQFLV